MGLGALQPGHLFVVLAIVLLIFGPGKLGDIGKSLGEGLRELKKAADPGDHKAPATPAPANTVGTTVATQLAGRACPSCNATVPPTDKFCGVCGKTMETPTRVA
jgi:sec-independent protein translocase protein TatA